ncbi:MAG: hypothetical protein QXM92_02505 [Candidatus Anstonellales archaeon]
MITTYLSDIKELSEEDKKKIRAVTANVIVTMAMPRPDQLQVTEIKEKYDALTKKLAEAINKDTDNNNNKDNEGEMIMQIAFDEDDDIPPEITSKIIAAYHEIINNALLQRRKEIVANTWAPYALPMDCRYYPVIYRIRIREREWNEDMREKGVRKEALPIDIVIRCEAIVHKPPHADFCIGYSSIIEHTIYLYSYKYDDELLSKADQIYAEIITWRTLIRSKNK